MPNRYIHVYTKGAVTYELLKVIFGSKIKMTQKAYTCTCIQRLHAIQLYLSVSVRFICSSDTAIELVSVMLGACA